jgi:hypothetical protein
MSSKGQADDRLRAGQSRYVAQGDSGRRVLMVCVCVGGGHMLEGGTHSMNLTQLQYVV